MKREDKQLLLVDLCARLPYKPFAQWHHKVLNEFRDVKIMKISTYGKNIDDYQINVLCQPEPGVDYEASIVDIKPYLRPMSSMTKEEKKEFIEYAGYEIEESVNGRHYEYYLKDFCGTPDNPSVNADCIDWLNKKMFDFRGLIPKGLANEAPEGMYK